MPQGAAHGSFHHWRGLLWRGAAAGQLQDLDVSEMNLRAFGLQAQVAFAHAALANAVHELAIDGQLHGAVHAHHIIGVPLALALAAELPGHAAASARVVRHSLQAVRSKKLAGDIAGVIRLAIFTGVKLRPFEFEHLHLHALGQIPLRWHAALAPDKNAAIATRLHVPPLNVQDEVFILPLAAHDADGLATAYEQAVFHLPSVSASVHIYPAREVFAVKKRLPQWDIFRSGGQAQEQEKNESFHGKIKRSGTRTAFKSWMSGSVFNIAHVPFPWR